MKAKRFIAVLFAALQVYAVMGQGDNRHLVRKGNAFYTDSMFVDAETSYREAIKANAADPVSHFNLGNTLLRERNPKDAAAEYEKVLKSTKNPLTLAKTYHNLGVIFQSQKQYAEAISNYENALRNNPKDDQCRYNLALCRHLLKNQKNNPNPQNNQDEQEKRDDKQQEKPQENDQSKQKQKQPTDDKMSKENAERLLDVAKQEEQRTQEKLRKGQRYATPRRLEKNW